MLFAFKIKCPTLKPSLMKKTCCSLQNYSVKWWPTKETELVLSVLENVEVSFRPVGSGSASCMFQYLYMYDLCVVSDMIHSVFER
jgi:hypothetical protein